MIAFANAQHNAHAAQDDAHVAIQMQGPLSLLVIRALRGALGNILSNRAYWVQMGLTRYIELVKNWASSQNRLHLSPCEAACRLEDH